MVSLKLPSFSLTRGQTPVGGSRMRGAIRRVRGIGGWIAISFGFFMLFAWLSLPTRAIAWRISHEAKKAGFVVDVEDVSVTIFGNVVLENVTWTFEPSRPDQVPRKFLVEEVEIDVSFLSLLFGNVDIEVEATRGDEGRIWAEYVRDADESSFKLEVEDLPLYDVPKAGQSLGAPLSGLFALKIDLTMPENKFAKANGTIEITCALCTIGDGDSKLYIPGSKGLKDGVTIPTIDLGTFVGKMVVEKGSGKTEGAMETKSDDIELSVTGGIKFKDPFPKSRLDMTVKFNVTDAMQAKSEKLRLVIQGSDPKSKLDPPEKGLGYILTGALERPSFRGIKTKTARDTAAEKRARQQKREAKKRKPSDDDDKAAKPDPNEPIGAIPGDPNSGIDVEPTPPPSGTVPPTPTSPVPAVPPSAPPSMPPPTTAPPVEPTPTEPSPEPPPSEPPAEPPPVDPGQEVPPPQGDTGDQPSIIPEDGQLSGGPPPQQ